MNTAAPQPRLRPRAPDVQIYRPQLTSVLSILHRATGVWLSIGSVLLVVWLALAAGGGSAYDAYTSWWRTPLGLVLAFLWTFALFYHLCNGIRHLAWDMDFGFELRSIYLSGWAVVITSTLLTLAAWILGLTLGR